MHPSQPHQPSGAHPPVTEGNPGGYPTGAQQPTTVYPTVGPPPPPPPPAGQYAGTVHGRRPRRDLRVRLGDALVAGGSLLVVLFSFAPFISYTDADLIERLEEENLPTWFSAWALETFLAPLSWWVIFAALGLIALVAARVFAGFDREYLGFKPSHVKVGLALFCGFVLLGYALSAKTLIYGSDLQDESFANALDGDLSYGWGGFLMLVGALVAAAGAVLDHLGVGPEVWPLPQRPQQPYGQPGYPPGQPYPYQAQPGHQPPVQTATYQSTYPAEAYQPTQMYPQQTSPGQSPPPGGAAPPDAGQPRGDALS